MINILETAISLPNGNFITDAWRAICFAIDSMIYKLLSFLHSLFYYTSIAEFKDTKIFTDIISNIGLLIGICMLFAASVNLIKYVVDPDKIKDAKTGGSRLIIKIVVSICLLASVNSIFDLSRQLQKTLIDDRIIENVLLGGREQYKGENKDTSIALSLDVLTSFIGDNKEASGTTNKPRTIELIKTEAVGSSTNIDGTSQLIENSGATGEKGRSIDSVLSEISNGITKKDEKNQYYYTYNTVVCLIVGAFFCWIYFGYIFSVGVRTVQLWYLQIISPIPIVAYMFPKGEDKLNAWTKQCITTYLDLFIRIFIINFAIILVKAVFAEQMVIDATIEDATLKGWVTVVLALAVLMFAKKAPDLIKELFPGGGKASGDFGFSLKNRFKDNMAGAAVGGVFGGLAGMATGALSNKGIGKIGGALGGLGRGTLGGLTGKKAGDIMKKTADIGSLQRNGVGFLERTGRNIGGKFGAETKTQRYDRLLKENALARQKFENVISDNESKKKLGDQIKERAKTQAYKNHIQATTSSKYAGYEYGKVNGQTAKVNASNSNITGDINSIKTAIDLARESGSNEFSLDGKRFYSMSYADSILKDAEKTAGKVYFNTGGDTQIESMLQTYGPGFAGDADAFYTSVTGIDNDIYDKKYGNQDYQDLLDEKSRLEREKERVRGNK